MTPELDSVIEAVKLRGGQEIILTEITRVVSLNSGQITYLPPGRYLNLRIGDEVWEEE